MTDEASQVVLDDDVSLLDLLLVVAENARLIVFGSLGAGLVALAFAFTLTPVFTATTTILPPQQQQSTAAMLASQLNALAGIAGLGGSGPKNPADLYVALIKSRTVADGIIDRFDLVKLYALEKRQDARKALADVSKVNAGKDGLITIEVDNPDPKRAAAMANAYVEELAKLTDGLAITEAQQRRIFFEKQLRQAKDGLKKAEVALGQAGAGETIIRAAPQAMVEGVARLKALVTAQEIRVSTMRGYLTEQNPEFQLAQRGLASLRAQLAQAERDQPSAGGQGAEYLNRFREFKYQETLFELLAKQYEAARLDEAREGANIQVVDVALPPERKSRPKKALIAVSTMLAGGMLLVLYVFFRESLRNARAVPESAGKIGRIAAGFRRLAGRR